MVILYNDGDYKTVITYTDSILKNATLKGQEEIYLRTYRAYSFVALTENRKAKAEFVKILNIDSTYTLNPDIVSPKIINVFNEVKSKWMKNRIYSEIQKGKQEKPQPVAPSSFATYTYPGIYQDYIGEKKKGKVLKWSFIGGAGILIVSQVGYTYTHYMYLQQRQQPEIDKWYTWYNLFYKVRKISFGFTVSVFVYNFLDISLTNKKD